MSSKLFFLIFINFILSDGVYSQRVCSEILKQKCPSVPDGEPEPVLTLLPIANDCNKFIKCERGYQHIKHCPAGLHFSPGIDVCDWPKNVNCVPCSETPSCKQETCPVIPENEAEKVLTLLKVSSDCTKFVHCDRGVSYIKDCPAGLHFNIDLHVCDWPENVNCVSCSGSGSMETEATTTKDGTITNAPSSTTLSSENPDTGEDSCEPKICPFVPINEAEPVLTLLRVPSDCTKFITCDRGVPYLQNCPDGLYFNPILDVCDWPRNVQCLPCKINASPKPPTECEEQQECPRVPENEAEAKLTLLPIVNNCKNFIICDRGVPYEMNCPRKLHFNRLLDVCDWPENANCPECD